MIYVGLTFLMLFNMGAELVMWSTKLQKHIFSSSVDAEKMIRH